MGKANLFLFDPIGGLAFRAVDNTTSTTGLHDELFYVFIGQKIVDSFSEKVIKIKAKSYFGSSPLQKSRNLFRSAEDL